MVDQLLSPPRHFESSAVFPIRKRLSLCAPSDSTKRIICITFEISLRTGRFKWTRPIALSINRSKKIISAITGQTQRKVDIESGTRMGSCGTSAVSSMACRMELAVSSPGMDIKRLKHVWKAGMLHGTARFWTEEGNPPLVLEFKNGVNQTPRKVEYKYLAYTPKGYEDFPEKQWPIIIYLHGGSDRGTDLKKVYSSGVPDQIYRGREFPFLVVAPQCPALLRWSTDDWFGTFYKEVTAKYRVDKNRVYLTGVSLGGEGVWYLAAKYPDLFAAIAPISGFTSRTTFIDKNLKSLVRLPIWAFHGDLDLVVPVEETRRMIEQLKGQNPRLKFTFEPSAGHWIHWSVYPGDELYDWFLTYDKGSQR